MYYHIEKLMAATAVVAAVAFVELTPSTACRTGCDPKPATGTIFPTKNSEQLLMLDQCDTKVRDYERAVMMCSIA